MIDWNQSKLRLFTIPNLIEFWWSILFLYLYSFSVHFHKLFLQFSVIFSVIFFAATYFINSLVFLLCKSFWFNRIFIVYDLSQYFVFRFSSPLEQHIQSAQMQWNLCPYQKGNVWNTMKILNSTLTLYWKFSRTTVAKLVYLNAKLEKSGIFVIVYHITILTSVDCGEWKLIAI